MNGTLQATFCGLVLYLPEARESFSDEGIASFEAWVAETSEATWVGVCRQDQGLTTAYNQFDVYGEAASYTTKVFLDMFEQGPVLCSVVLFTWILSMANAIQNIAVFVMSVTFAHSRESRMMRLEEVLKNNKSFAVRDIPTIRVAWIFFVGAQQLAVALTLMIYGALWMVQSTQNSELFLNTLALSYIMDIDELVFQAMVPREVSYIITNMDGLPLRRRVQRWTGLRHVPLGSVMTISTVTCAFCFFYFTQLSPLVDSVREVKQVMCPEF